MKRELLIEMAQIAVRSIRGNRLRTGLTIGIIGLGIMASISMTTATSSLEANVVEQFSSLGTDVFTFTQKTETGVNRGRRVTVGEPISYEEAQAFAEEAPDDQIVAYSIFGTSQATLTRGTERTNPNIQVLGVEENYFDVSGYSVERGRNFTRQEAQSANRLTVIGADLVKELFNEWEEPVGAEFSIGAQRYTIIGVLEARGCGVRACPRTTSATFPSPVYASNSPTTSGATASCASRPRPEDVMELAEAAVGAMRVVRRIAQGRPLLQLIHEQQHGLHLERRPSEASQLRLPSSALLPCSGRDWPDEHHAGERFRTDARNRHPQSPRCFAARHSDAVPHRSHHHWSLGGAVGIALGVAAGNGIAYAMDTPFVVPGVDDDRCGVEFGHEPHQRVLPGPSGRTARPHCGIGTRMIS